MAPTLNLDDEKNLALKRYLEQMNKSGPTAQENAIAEQAAADRRSNAYVAQMADAASLMGATAGGSQADTSGFRKGLEQMSAASDAEAQRRLAGIQQQRQGEMSVNKYLADKFENRQMKEGEYAQQEKLKGQTQDWEREKLGIENKYRTGLESQKFQNELALEQAKQGMQTKAMAKANQETNYRANIMVENASKLKDLIKQNGTAPLTGPAGAQMDSLIYQMAIDFAKAVDPESIAREGEVAAAQKYMLPIRNYGGFAQTNETAVQLVDNYIADLSKRLESRRMAQTGGSPSYKFEASRKSSDGTAMAADKSAQQYTQADYDAYNDLLKNPTAPGSDELRQHLQRIGLIDKMKNQMGGQQIYGGQ